MVWYGIFYSTCLQPSPSEKSSSRREKQESMGASGYTWVSYGMEAW